ncbi:replication protein A 70 kDa DNA-binding subunit B [Tanacetum coccineum]
MEITSNTNLSREDKGKMVAAEPEITNVSDLTSTDSNKIIEVLVYRKWVSKHNQTRQPTKFCCILLDKQGTPIQANMDVADTEYFNQLLQLGATYRISGFSCAKTPSWERTLRNDTSLIFGKYLQAHNIPNDNFPQHYFDFAAYNELPGRANVKDAVLTGLQLSATSATHYYLNPNIPETLHIKQQNEQSTDRTPFLIINNQRYEDPNLERTRNRFPLATLLKINPQNYQHVRFTSEATIFRINTQKEWYYQRCSICGKKVIPEVPIAKCKDHGPQPTAIYSYSFKAILSDGSATTSITCFSNQANTLTRDVHEVLAELADKNPYHIPESLRQLEGTTHTFQFHFDTLSTSRRPDFVLDTVFQDAQITDQVLKYLVDHIQRIKTP